MCECELSLRRDETYSQLPIWQSPADRPPPSSAIPIGRSTPGKPPFGALVRKGSRGRRSLMTFCGRGGMGYVSPPSSNVSLNQDWSVGCQSPPGDLLLANGLVMMLVLMMVLVQCPVLSSAYVVDHDR